jgi:hypothetical protein
MTVHRLLPKLTINRQFVDDFLAAKSPCFAFGLIEERRQTLGLLALRHAEVIPPQTMSAGFNFGHSVLGNTDFEVVHFAFEFYGFGVYNTLINPNNPLARAVLARMIDRGEYFFLAVGPGQGVTAFRAEIGQGNLAGLKDHWARIQGSTTNDVQYQKALREFQEHPDPTGHMLSWVCRDNLEYLDLTKDRMEMAPTAPQESQGMPGLGSEQQAIVRLQDDKVNQFTQTGGSDSLMLLAHMAPHTPLFHRLMKISGEGEIDSLCVTYPGLYRYAKVLERLAMGIRSGEVEVPR